MAGRFLGKGNYRKRQIKTLFAAQKSVKLRTHKQHFCNIMFT